MGYEEDKTDQRQQQDEEKGFEIRLIGIITKEKNFKRT